MRQHLEASGSVVDIFGAAQAHICSVEDIFRPVFCRGGTLTTLEHLIQTCRHLSNQAPFPLSRSLFEVPQVIPQISSSEFLTVLNNKLDLVWPSQSGSARKRIHLLTLFSLQF